ncbi:MAG: sialate O-acetylesterase [Elusimicrobia bacterium]|nr:sialate O-acetylesterase [Candidatus Obscuribacterium magneticum]
MERKIYLALFSLILTSCVTVHKHIKDTGNISAKPESTKGSNPPTPIATTSQPMALYIAMGQSNMTGYTTIYKGDYKILSSSIEFLNNPGDGPIVPFALEMAMRKIAVLNCAASATYISEWSKDGHLYKACLERIPTGYYEVKGLIFDQGEADTNASERATYNWRKCFMGMIKDFRKRYGNIPVVLGILGNKPDFNLPWWDAIKKQQLSISKRKLGNVRKENLPLIDLLHYTREGYDEIGHRFAEVMKSFSRNR